MSSYYANADLDAYSAQTANYDAAHAAWQATVDAIAADFDAAHAAWEDAYAAWEANPVDDVGNPVPAPVEPQDDAPRPPEPQPPAPPTTTYTTRPVDGVEELETRDGPALVTAPNLVVTASSGGAFGMSPADFGRAYTDAADVVFEAAPK